MKLLLLSGGLDSTVLFYDLWYNKAKFKCIWIDYGQANAEAEKKCVEALCHTHSVELLIIDASHIFDGVNSTLLKKGAKHSVETDELLNRNAVLISIAASHCTEKTTVLVAAHKTGAGYQDATYEFYKRMSKAIHWSTNCLVDVNAPYIKYTKKGIVKRAWDIGVTLEEITASVSCYEGNNCGKCPACEARKQALLGIYEL